MDADACNFDALGKRGLAGEGHAFRPLIRRPENRGGALGFNPLGTFAAKTPPALHEPAPN
jgi:hypothetical protein